jgi:hypothetical protein
MSEVIDISRDAETGEITQFTVIREDGQPDLVKGTAENLLLYDPAEELPFDNGMHDFLHGDQTLVLSQDDPVVMVAPTSSAYCYILRVRDRTVETTPSQAERLLRGVKDAVIDDEISGLVSLHDDIVSTQVRVRIVNKLMSTFDESGRLRQTDRGWLVDDFYLVNWEASLYTRHNDPDTGDFKRAGGGIQKTDTSKEFVKLRHSREIEPAEVSIGSTTVRLSEREMLFLAKVKWLLHRREQHPDLSFWMFSDKYASVDSKTGE